MSQQKNSIKCKGCNISFIPYYRTVKFCSEECKREYGMKNSFISKANKSRIKYPDDSDPYNYSECKICGFRSYNLGTHPLSHGMTSSEYITNYGPVHSQKSIDYMKNNNPWSNHNGKFSPHSKKYIKYDGLTEDIILDTINEIKKKSVNTKNDNNNNSTKIEYYISRGMSIEEATIALSNRQTTFSLTKCIEKYGEQEGRKIWADRQTKWQNVLKNKSPEEIQNINKRKSTKINFKSLWNRKLSEPGHFYIIKISENRYKIGITSKSNIFHRYKKDKLSKYEIILFEKVSSIKHAFEIEQLLKWEYSNTIKKDNYDGFGWTEVIEESIISNLISKYNYFLSEEICENKFKEVYHK